MANDSTELGINSKRIKLDKDQDDNNWTDTRLKESTENIKEDEEEEDANWSDFRLAQSAEKDSDVKKTEICESQSKEVNCNLHRENETNPPPKIKPTEDTNNDVEQRCLFKCLWCGQYETRSYKELQKHVRESHSKVVTYENAHEYATKLRWYSCGRCRRSFIHDPVVVSRHEKFCKGRTDDSIRKSVAETGKKRSEFECLWCGQFRTSYTKTLRQHWKKRHFSEYSASYSYRVSTDYEAHATKLVLFSCKRCCAVVVDDSFLTARHESSMCPANKCVKNTSKTGSKRMECRVNMKVSSYVEDFKRKMLLKTVPKMSSDRSLVKTGLPLSIPKENTTYEVANLCLYSCKKCQQTFRNIRFFFRHTKACVGNYKVGVGTIRETRYHVCKVCEANILCDEFYIETHVNNRHKMSLSKYRFVLPKPSRADALKASVKQLPSSFRPSFMTLNSLEHSLVPSECVTSEIACLCRYVCHECRYETVKWTLMKMHIKRCRNSNTFNSNYLKETRVFECKLCRTRMLCDTYCIGRHLSYSHGIDHFEEYKNAQPQKVSGKEDTLASKLNRLTQTEAPSVKPLPDTSNPPNSLPDDVTTTEIGNFCVFACNKCDYRHNKLFTFREHLKRDHKGEKVTFQSVVHTKTARYHKCKLCFWVILCEVAVMQNHLRKSHFVSLERYQELKDGDATELEEDSEDGEKIRRTVPTTDINLLDKQPSVFTLPQNKLNPTEMADRVANACLFKCGECPKTFYSWASLKIHLSLKHSHHVRHFSKRYVVEARFHRCRLCDKAVLCDEWLIFRHVNGAHKLSSHEKYPNMCNEKTLLRCI